MNGSVDKQVLLLTACFLGGFGLVVLLAVAAGRAKGRSRRAGLAAASPPGTVPTYVGMPWPDGWQAGTRPLVAKYLMWFVMIPPIILPLVYSRPLFQVVVCLLSLQCLREFAHVTGLWADRGMMRLCYLLTAGMYVPIVLGQHALHQAAPALAVGVLVLVPIVRGRYEHMLQKVSLSVLGVLYFGWFLSHLASLRNLAGGAACAFFLMALVVSNDALAYLWGTWLGRHRLSARISPNKTIEGAVGAAACVLLLGLLLRGLLGDMGIARAMLLAGVISALGICGDLVVSFIKRDLGVKDMGSAIPAHGGLLDRCDSLILAAPVFYHAVRYFHAA